MRVLSEKAFHLELAGRNSFPNPSHITLPICNWFHMRIGYLLMLIKPIWTFSIPSKAVQLTGLQLISNTLITVKELDPHLSWVVWWGWSCEEGGSVFWIFLADFPFPYILTMDLPYTS